jgi:hypothetical protein
VTEPETWQPIAPAEVTDLLAELASPWWLAGGWAIELAAGRSFRPHGDIDVLVLRGDLLAVQDVLRGWDLHASDPPGRLRPWQPGERLPALVHDIWCRRTPESPWSLQLMVDDTDGADWVFRRDHRVRRPASSLAGPASRRGLPVLTPEVQLLYKSGAGRGSKPRAKDEADFEAMLPVLDPPQRRWLVGALRLLTPGHPWLARLS